MIRYLEEALSLILAAGIVFGLIYQEVSVSTLQQIIVIGILLVLVILRKYGFSQKFSENVFSRLFLLLAISLFIQLLVVTSGGFYSPFLILYHLFAVGLGFLVSLFAAVVFSFLGIAVLIAQLLLEPNLLDLFKDDPGAVILYGLSLMIILPVNYLIASRYWVKDKLSNILSTQVDRDRLLLGGVSDLVIIITPDLKIISFNEAADLSLKLSSGQFKGKPLFQTLVLKDASGAALGPDYFSLEQIMQDKTTRIFNDILLYPANSSLPKKVSVQVKPTTTAQGKVDQIFFIISGGKTSGVSQSALDILAPAFQKHALEEKQFNKAVDCLKLNGLKLKEIFLQKQEEDLFKTLEIKDHGLNLQVEQVDLLAAIKQAIEQDKDLFNNLKINLLLIYDDKDLAAAFPYLLSGESLYSAQITPLSYNATLDRKWFVFLVRKVLEINVLLSLDQPNSQIKVILTSSQGGYDLIVVTTEKTLPQDSLTMLTEVGYGTLAGNSSLGWGSLLEGFLMKNISIHMGISFSLDTKDHPKSVIIRLIIPQTPIV